MLSTNTAQDIPLSKLFITGCDSNTEWQLPWFVRNFRKHNPDAELLIYDFGMEGDLPTEIVGDARHKGHFSGWMHKPAAMHQTHWPDMVCWLDTDCEVRANLDGIWNHVEEGKISMGEDKPWSSRRGETWHNSGVVAWKGKPEILNKWNDLAFKNPQARGDQELLHEYLKIGLNRIKHIHTLPNIYNVLRLQLQDGTAPNNAKIMHWTGPKGNLEIKRQMNA